MAQFIDLAQAAGAVRTDLSRELLADLWLAMGEVTLVGLLDNLGRMDEAAIAHHAALTTDLFRRVSAPAQKGASPHA